MTAFVSTVNLAPSRLHRAGACTSALRPTMAATPATFGPVSRRAALRLFSTAVGALALAAPLRALADKRKEDDFDLGELKRDVEALEYDEEVTDVGPDSQEKNPTRTKKKKVAPVYVEEEKEVIEGADKKYDAMVAKEKDAAARIKAEFSK